MPVPPPPEPSLSREEQDVFGRGIDQFNARHFFECHDTLEDLWSGVRGPSRDFFQGLIQVAVGFYHLGNENRGGAARLLDRARRRLEGYPDRYGGIDLAALRAAVASWQGVLDGQGESASWPPVPTLRVVDGAERGARDTPAKAGPK